MSPNWHPSAADLGRCLRGELPDTQAGRVADHVDTCPDCQAALESVSRPAPAPLGPPPDVPGFTLLDDGKPLGAGGMGEVFRAVEDGIGREVAVKIVHRSHAAHPHRSRLVFRFVEEVRLLGRIQHAGVPPVYRFGFLGPGADQPYLVMRLVPWPTLADELAADWAPASGGPTPDRLNLYLIWFGRACEAVGYAHDHGAVHLDVKPANIKVHVSGEVQVLDWGLGRGFMPTPGKLTQLFSPSAVEIDLGPVGHSDGYSPPEQVRGGHPDRKMHPRADVFALGSVLCEILTGLPAFAGATAGERFDKAWRADLADAHARLDRAARDHPQLAALARRCLAAEPEPRPETAGAVAAEVRRIILSAEERLRSARWRFRMGAAAAAVFVAAAATAGGIAYRESEHERKTAQHALKTDAATQELAAQKQKRVEDEAEAHVTATEAAAAAANTGAFDDPDVREAQAVRWAVAFRATDAAAAAISGRAVSEAVARRVSETTARVEAAVAAFQADRALLDALDRARVRKVYYPDPDPDVVFSGAYFYSRAGAKQFAEAFRSAGLVPGRAADRQEAFVAAVRSRPRVAARVVAALDQWHLLDRAATDPWVPDLADRLDPDPVRRAVRTAARGGRLAVQRLIDDDAALPGRLSPEAALLLAAALELNPGDPGAADPDGRNTRWVGEAARLLEAVAARPAADRWGTFWLRLTLGFYLWSVAGDHDDWGPAAAAVPHLQAAEDLLPARPPAGSVAADLRTAAGGLRAHVEARRARPDGVATALDRALEYYPDYWPTRHLAVLARLDLGDARGAYKAAAAWKARHKDSAVAQGYLKLAEAVERESPLDADAEVARLLREPKLSELDLVQLDDLRRVTEVRPPAEPPPPRPGDRHPTRPGRDLVLVVDARVRLDRVLAKLAPDRGLRPWRLGTADPFGDRLGRDVADDWATPEAAEKGYRRAADAAPWATGPVHGQARAHAAGGYPAAAAAAADRVAAAPGLAPRPALVQLYRARLHEAAAAWGDDRVQAKEHRRKADAALRLAAADARLAAHVHSARVQAEAAELAWQGLLDTERAEPAALCALAEAGVRELGPCWLTARLAARPFFNRGLVEKPFAVAGDVPGGAAAVARCAVFAAWGFRDVPPDPRLTPGARVALLGHVRRWAARPGWFGATPPAVAEFLRSPVVVAFLHDLDYRSTLPAAGEPTELDKSSWEAEQRAWLEFRREHRGRDDPPRE